MSFERILNGVRRFRSIVFPQQRHLFRALAHSQHPDVLFIGCSDSRVLPNLITQTNPGELFLARHVGNIVPPGGGPYGGVSATIEYSVRVLGVRHIILCGHSDCGAMRAVLHGEKLQGLPSVEAWLRYAEPALRAALARRPGGNPEEQLEELTRQNVILQLENLKTHPAVAEAMAQHRLEVHGWQYEIETGDVRVYQESLGRFLRL